MTAFAPFQCTAETPWHDGLPTPVQHHGAEEVGEQEDGWPGGDIEFPPNYRKPNP